MTTNVKPDELNYDHYADSKYDLDIVNSVPYHRELHKEIYDFVKKNFNPRTKYKIIDLGAGTGITTKIIQDMLPNSEIDVVDFSKVMMSGAKKKLGTKNVKYISGDYSKLKFNKKYDLVISVIGIHHQNTKGKKKVFKKIYKMLNPEGVFIFGDLVTYKNKITSAKNHALHYHHLVEKSTDEKTLAEWAHHHMYLNDLATIEDQIIWLKNEGFKVKTGFLKINTALLFCKK